MKKGKIIIWVSALCITLVAGIAVGRLLNNETDNNTKESGFKTVSNVSKQENNQQITDSRQTAITRVVQTVSPAIVGINVEEVREVQDPFSQFFGDDPFFRQYFGNRGSQQQVVRGLGSGYIISQDGYILTNHHVAGNASKISVTMTTGETVDAKLIGADEVSDVAILKIDRSNLPFVRLGNSDNVLEGEWAIALGNPFGLFEINDKPTVTVGVVSATKMKVMAEGRKVYKDMIQTDASINSGNSGGPLLNADGEVIGMNTIIYTGGQYNQGSIGVGFAISINRVKSIVDELRSKGSITRVSNPGFTIQTIDDRIASYLKLTDKRGVIVTQVQRGGKADESGLKPEDIITQANGERVNNEQDLIMIVNDMRAGERLSLKVNREGSDREIEISL